MGSKAISVNDSMQVKVVGIFAGFVAGTLVAAVVAIFMYRDETPHLTAEAYAAAAARWDRQEIDSYDLEVALSGQRSDRIRINVRDGVPVSLSINGQPIPNVRVWETWTVDGQFAFIGEDIDLLDGVDTSRNLRVWAEFDAEKGFPRRYRRIEAAQPETGWRLVSFKVVEPGRSSN